MPFSAEENWDMFSEMHKEAYGIRPRGKHAYEWWCSQTNEERDATISVLRNEINKSSGV